MTIGRLPKDQNNTEGRIRRKIQDPLMTLWCVFKPLTFRLQTVMMLGKMDKARRFFSFYFYFAFAPPKPPTAEEVRLA
jgi:hypothetical protein